MVVFALSALFVVPCYLNPASVLCKLHVSTIEPLSVRTAAVISANPRWRAAVMLRYVV